MSPDQHCHQNAGQKSGHQQRARDALTREWRAREWRASELPQSGAHLALIQLGGASPVALEEALIDLLTGSRPSADGAADNATADNATAAQEPEPEWSAVARQGLRPAMEDLLRRDAHGDARVQSDLCYAARKKGWALSREQLMRRSAHRAVRLFGPGLTCQYGPTNPRWSDGSWSWWVAILEAELSGHEAGECELSERHLDQEAANARDLWSSLPWENA